MGLQCTIKLSVGFRKDQETGLFVGWCPDLDVYSQGETQEEAKSGIESAINMFLKHGGIEKIIKEKGLNTIKLCPENSVMTGPIMENYNRAGTIDLAAQFRREEELCQHSA